MSLYQNHSLSRMAEQMEFLSKCGAPIRSEEEELPAESEDNRKNAKKKEKQRKNNKNS